MPTTKSLIDISVAASTCTQCELCKGRVKPVFARGNVDSKVIIVGMCPGPDENRIGTPFVGTAGQILDSIIDKTFGDTSVYITNLVKCFVQPGVSLKNEWIDACLPFLIAQIGFIQPKVIILLGKDVCSYLAKSSLSMGSLRGLTFPYMGATAIMTYHPSFLSRGGGVKHPSYTKVVEDFRKSFLFF